MLDPHLPLFVFVCFSTPPPPPNPLSNERTFWMTPEAKKSQYNNQ